MSKASEHFSPEELKAYCRGQLSEERSAVIDQHLLSCETCCDAVTGLSENDTLVELLQSVKVLPTQNGSQNTGEDSNKTSDSVTNSTATPLPLLEHPRYELTGVLGQGGMGRVYRARHRVMDRDVALKVIHRSWLKQREAVERFHREVQSVARLDHPNVVRAYDAEQVDDVHFLVMEYVDGTDLAATVSNHGPLPIEQACDYIRQVATGLAYANQQGMVHRDIKPHNLIVTKAGVVKILDFGLASLAPPTNSSEPASSSIASENTDLEPFTKEGSVMGTPDFMAPEQVKDARNADHRSDTYSLGLTFYYLLAGRIPFTAATVAEKLKQQTSTEPAALQTLRNDIPTGLIAIINRMIAKRPEDRFQTSREVADALAPYAEPKPGSAAQTNRQTPSLRPSTTAAITIAAVSIAAVVIAALVLWQTQFGKRNVPPQDQQSSSKDENKNPKVIATVPGNDDTQEQASAANKPSEAELAAIGWVKSVAGRLRRKKVRDASGKKQKGPVEYIDVARGAGSPRDAVRVDDEGLKCLAAFPQLRELGLGMSPKVTANGIGGLAKLPKLFDLSYTPHKRDCIQALSQLTRLQRLNLFQGKVNDSDLSFLAKLQLRKLCLSYTSVSDDGVKYIATQSKLDALHLQKTAITDAGTQQLAAIESLRTLNLSDTTITKSGLKELTKLTRLQVLSIEGLGFGDAEIELLSAFPELEKLSLHNNPVGDPGMETLAKLKELRRLCLAGTKITDRGLLLLAQCKKLEMIDLYDTKVTRKAIATLKKSLPKCVVTVSFSYGGIPDLKIKWTKLGPLLSASEDSWP